MSYHKHTTTTGQGAVIVTVNYRMTEDGDIDLCNVMFNGIDILDAIAEEQADVLVDSCAYAYEAWAAQQNEELRIEQHIKEAA